MKAMNISAATDGTSLFLMIVVTCSIQFDRFVSDDGQYEVFNSYFRPSLVSFDVSRPKIRKKFALVRPKTSVVLTTLDA